MALIFLILREVFHKSKNGAMHDPSQDQNTLALVASVASVAPAVAEEGGADEAPVSAPTLAALERGLQH